MTGDPFDSYESDHDRYTDTAWETDGRAYDREPETILRRTGWEHTTVGGHTGRVTEAWPGRSCDRCWTVLDPDGTCFWCDGTLVVRVAA